MATTTFFRCSIREAESKAEQSIGSVDKKKKKKSFRMQAHPEGRRLGSVPKDGGLKKRAGSLEAWRAITSLLDEEMKVNECN